MPDTADWEARFADLETRFAHTEQALNDLSDVTREQWDLIDLLKRRVERLQDRINELEQGGGPGRAEDEKPPHY